jgi:hypothetical protein
MALFQRILKRTCQLLVDNVFGELLESTIVQVRLSEFLLLSAVVGAFVALAAQSEWGPNGWHEWR